MVSKSFSHDVIISGGGTPGLTLALLLAQAGITVALIDPAPLSSFKLGKPEGRTSALMQSALHTLKKAGIWDQCRAHGAPLEILRIIDDSTGGERHQIETDFPASDIGLEYFGINMPNNILRTTLALSAVKHKKITLHDSLGPGSSGALGPTDVVPGKTVTLMSNVYLAESMTLGGSVMASPGATLVVSSGVTLRVAEGKTLVLQPGSTLDVQGTVEGTCTNMGGGATITGAGKGLGSKKAFNLLMETLIDLLETPEPLYLFITTKLLSYEKSIKSDSTESSHR